MVNGSINVFIPVFKKAKEPGPIISWWNYTSEW